MTIGTALYRIARWIALYCVAGMVFSGMFAAVWSKQQVEIDWAKVAIAGIFWPGSIAAALMLNVHAQP